VEPVGRSFLITEIARAADRSGGPTPTRIRCAPNRALSFGKGRFRAWIRYETEYDERPYRRVWGSGMSNARVKAIFLCAALAACGGRDGEEDTFFVAEGVEASENQEPGGAETATSLGSADFAAASHQSALSNRPAELDLGANGEEGPAEIWSKGLYDAPLWHPGTLVKFVSEFSGGTDRVSDDFLFWFNNYIQPCAHRYAFEQKAAGNVFPYTDVLRATRAYLEALPDGQRVFRATSHEVSVRPYDFELGAFPLYMSLRSWGNRGIEHPYDPGRGWGGTGTWGIYLGGDEVHVRRENGRVGANPFANQCKDWFNVASDHSSILNSTFLETAPGFPFLYFADEDTARAMSPVFQSVNNTLTVDVLFTVSRIDGEMIFGDAIGGAIYIDPERAELLSTWGEITEDELGNKPPGDEVAVLDELMLDLDFPTYE